MAQEKHFNVDDAEEYDDGTRAVTYSDDERLRSDSETEATATLSSSRKQRLAAASFKKTKQRGERASALRVKNWDAGEMDGAAYAGKVVKRKDVTAEDDDDEGMASPDEDAMAEWSDAEPFGESGDEEEQEEQEEEEDEEASVMGSDSDGSDEEDDDEQDAEKLIRGFQKEDSAQLMSSKDTAKLVEKATHVRNQKLIWERCLEIQIYTKRLLTSTKQSAAAVEASSNDDKAALLEQLFSCIDAVSTLQDKLCNSSELSVEPRDESTKRKRSIDAVWSDITEANEQALPQYNDILNTYSRKTNLAGGSQAKKFKAVNQDILAQVESVLADPQRVKRKAHAPMDTPTTNGDNGHTTAEEEDSSDQLDELMYDDSDFYQQLLKEFIESGGGSQDAIIRRTHRKKKKVVNRKASKGRVLRYTVHPKLENFTFPEPYPSSEMDVDELFRSIFGQARQA